MYNISISNQKELLLSYGSEVCSNFTYIKMYDNICNWLSNNNSNGLIILRDDTNIPNNGLGKSLLLRHILPNILFKEYRFVSHYINLRLFDLENYKKIIDSKKKCILIIDELGREPIVKDYGTGHDIMGTLMEYAEMYDCLVIIASNMSGSEISKKYDNAVIERISSMCYKVKCSGSSLRKTAEL